MTAPSIIVPSHDFRGANLRGRLRPALAILLMCAAVSATYFPVRSGESPPDADGALLGLDFMNLHVRRLRFVHETLFEPEHYLPGWYPREFGGTPFWSNIQNFPLIPPRLAILPFDPQRAFLPGVQIAANLSALFMFLYCRRLQIGSAGSAVAGYTFACSGFFASRVFAGHLPLLEAYCALPLLLWLVEANLQSPLDDRWRPLKLLASAFAACAIALAGHPQLPVYAFFVTALYILFRARNRRGLTLGAAMVLGTGAASFALYPMLLLIGRSTRVLVLDAPTNDLAFPYGRVAAFIVPDFHGRMPPDFHGYPDVSYFWDTVCYVGLLPIVACAVFLVRWVIFGTRPSGVWTFLMLAGVLSLLLALPAWHAVMLKIPGTILRSPSRQIYVTTFALAIAGGALVDLVVRYANLKRRTWALALVGIAVIAHAWDLGYVHDRKFVVMLVLPPNDDSKEGQNIGKQLGDRRIAIDYSIWKTYNRQIDDIGVFDSILLARPYRAILELTGAPPTLNYQNIDGGHLNARTNQFFGVGLVLTRTKRPDLPEVASGGGVYVYSLPGALPRASLVPLPRTQFLSEHEIHDRLKDHRFDLGSQLLLPADAPRPGDAPAPSEAPGLNYQRPRADEIVVKLTSPWQAYLRILETWDPGWRATIDGAPAPVLPAYDTFIAIPITPGSHEIRLKYHTPGVAVGWLMSGLSLVGLCGLCWREWRGRAKTIEAT